MNQQVVTILVLGLVQFAESGKIFSRFFGSHDQEDNLKLSGSYAYFYKEASTETSYENQYAQGTVEKINFKGAHTEINRKVLVEKKVLSSESFNVERKASKSNFDSVLIESNSDSKPGPVIITGDFHAEYTW